MSPTDIWPCIYLFTPIFQLNVLSLPGTHAGGCRAHLWRQPKTSAPTQTSQRRKTQVSGNIIKSLNRENMCSKTYLNMFIKSETILFINQTSLSDLSGMVDILLFYLI